MSLDPQHAAAFKGLAVLLVEDNRDLADSLLMVLRFWGCEVRWAANGAEALKHVESWTPGVALIDLGLPGMDGLDIAKAFKESMALQNCALMAVTGSGTGMCRQECQQAGFDFFLSKPVELRMLHKLLQAAMLRHALAASQE